MGKAAQNEHDQNSLYKRDPYTWALEQARALRERRSAALDWDNVAEEIEDVGQRQRDKLTSYLARILQHLWKLSHWSSMRTRNQRIWRVEIDAYRDSAHQQLRRNPGLKGSIEDIFADAWMEARRELARDAAKLAANDDYFTTFADRQVYPEDCPWTVEQALDEDFWPDLEKNGNPT